MSTNTDHLRAAPPVRAINVPALVPWAMGAAGVGMLIYFGGVSLSDIAFHPAWSLGRMVMGLADELPALIMAMLTGALLVAPVWLIVHLLRGRR